MTIRFRARVPQGWHIDSRVEAFQFPGGEWHLKTPEDEYPTEAILTGCDAEGLVKLALWADYARSTGARPTAVIPYLPAARADRGVPFGARVYAGIINSAKLGKVVVFDPHSDIAPALIDNIEIVDSADTIVQHVFAPGGHPHEFVGIIAPDAGAVPRASRVADRVGLPLYTATKHRDFETGKLTGFQVEGLPEHGRLLVVDDICDGGGTFMGLAEAAGVGRERLALWVSHGIFSGAAHRLTGYYSDIWTTDSHPGAHRQDVGATVIPITANLCQGRN